MLLATRAGDDRKEIHVGGRWTSHFYWMRIWWTDSPSFGLFFFVCVFFGVIKSRILYGAHLSPAAQRSVRKTTTALSPQNDRDFQTLFWGWLFQGVAYTTAAKDL